MLHVSVSVAYVLISSVTGLSLRCHAGEILNVTSFCIFGIGASIISDKLIFAKSYH